MLLDLPVELLHLVYECLPLDAVKHFRLSSKLLADVGIEHVYLNMELFFLDESLDAIDVFRKQPLRARAVKSILYHNDRLCGGGESQTFREWNKLREENYVRLLPSSTGALGEGTSTINERGLRLLKRNNYPEVRRRHSKFELYKAFGNHMLLHAYQEYFQLDDYVDGGLAAMIEVCPRLESVSLALNHPITWSSEQRVKCFREAMTYPQGGPPLDDMLTTVLNAAHEHDRMLRSLRVHYLDTSFLKYDDEDAENFSAVLRHLHHLQLTLCTKLEGTDPDKRAAQIRRRRALYRRGKLFALYRDALELRSLAIGTAPVGYDVDLTVISRVCLTDIVGIVDVSPHPWRNLEHIHLTGFRCTEADLIGFLWRRGETLKSLSLGEVALWEGTWDSIFLKIAVGHMVALRAAWLVGGFHDLDEKAIFTFSRSLQAMTVTDLTARYEMYLVGGSMARARRKFPDDAKDYPMTPMPDFTASSS